ncbi:hypothetical protein BRD18_05505 [Halobacteriales archaeon SW_7_71_33]|nr:MAG: hypothetical protein BRD18_05505 [Halobacteriales archaeon SW_7_71_33]
MPMIAGTLEGCYLLTDRDLAPGTEADPERTLDRPVYRVRSFDGAVLAATDDGPYRTVDGRAWTPLGPGVGVGVRSVLVADGTYVGTDDGRVLRSPAGSGTADPTDGEWTECAEFTDPRRRNRTPDEAPSVRTLAAADGVLLAGLEVGGVVASHDGGGTWTDRTAGVHDDVHHLLPVGGGVLAACGNGCYWTTDAGRSWRRLDTGFEDFWYNYHRESLARDGTLHLGANAWGPEAPGGRLFELDVPAPRRADPTTGTDPTAGAAPTDRPLDGRDARAVPYPNDDRAFPLSWAAHDGDVYAGTMGVAGGFEQYAPAPLLCRVADGEGVRYERAAEVPTAPRSLAVL